MDGVGEGEGEKELCGGRRRLFEAIIVFWSMEMGRGLVGRASDLEGRSGETFGWGGAGSESGGNRGGLLPVVGLVEESEVKGLLRPGMASLKVKGKDVSTFMVTRSKGSLYSID